MGFKTWMPSAFETRFGEEYISDVLGGIEVKGRYRSYATLFKNRGFFNAAHTMLKLLLNDWTRKAEDPSYTGLKTVDIQNLKRNARELNTLLALTAAYLIANLALSDDDDEEGETTIATKIAIDMISRAQSDSTLFANPAALSKSTMAPAPAIKWVLDVMNIPAAVMRAVNSEDKRYDATYAAMNIARVMPMGSQWYSMYNSYVKE
jgi:hypothetical protein